MRGADSRPAFTWQVDAIDRHRETAKQAHVEPGQWFGGSIQSRQVHDMSGFRNGHIKLKIKAPANVAFRIGIYDTYTNQGMVTFPANTTVAACVA